MILSALLLAPTASASTDLVLRTCFRAASAGDRPERLFGSGGGFDCTHTQRSAPPGDYWVRSSPLPAVGPDIVVRSGSLWQERVTLYVRYADGTLRSVGFSSANAWRFLQLGAAFEMPLPAAAAPPVQLLWHVRGAANLRGLVLQPQLLSPDVAQRHALQLTAFYAGFVGLAGALLIFNIALGAALRQRFHLPYCAMVVFLIGYAASSSGLLGQVAGLDNNLRLRINVLLLAATLCSAMLFARRFFAPRVTRGWLRPAIDTAIAALLAASLAYVLFMPHLARLLDRVMTLAFFATLLLTLPLLWRGWHAEDRYARVFAFAWGLPLLTATARVLQALNLLDWSFWIDNSTLIAMALEAGCSALAIAWRIKQLNEDCDQAREQELRARLLADSDPLTGLMNRRSFLREAIGRSEPHVLVLVDIDHFKRVNETLGHDGGDQVLRVFADALRHSVPPEALLARFGGEEFAVLAPAAAIALPETILMQIRAATMPFDLAVTASLGSECGAIASEADWKLLYRSADDALFAAKRAGRDRLRWAEAA
ncbi:diguanylate cyclase (GGDEF)-like protein [Sphingomonas endophytica]|uniref:diguanylate cyclase n=1 Tax=Sphingomonas endophytica TaxID=869719 RepID=A0A7X0JEL2_9SPHN|nr:diguanylate cyclase [Sphingomonas endophytica]MBB6505106.1 diguanylate cyclase (GGDEF)-like protein [Sphingomonas endophytica]